MEATTKSEFCYNQVTV